MKTSTSNKTCVICGELFVPNKHNQKYCSSRCSDRKHNITQLNYKREWDWKRYHNNPEYRKWHIERNNARGVIYRQERAASGLCVRCGHPNDTPWLRTCTNCVEHIKGV